MARPGASGNFPQDKESTEAAGSLGALRREDNMQRGGGGMTMSGLH